MSFGCLVDCLERKEKESVTQPKKSETLFSPPLCSGTLTIIVIAIIGLVCLLFGICAVCILGCSQPGLILGIVFCSLSVVFLMLDYSLYVKRSLIGKANERLSKQLKINNRLVKDMTKAVLEDRSFKNDIIARNAEDIRILLEKTTVMCSDVAELKSAISLAGMNQPGASTGLSD